ncbi:MAG: GNAT family N-acetyltransferase [Pseudomonadota bacterium]
MTAPSLTAGPLTGRPLHRGDWGLILALHSDAESGRWLLPPGEQASEDRAQRVAANFAEHWLAEGFGPYLWSVRGRPVGYAGLRRSRLDGLPELEALWAMEPRHWGRGYATAAAGAALAADGPYPGDDLSVAAWTLPDNAASLRVMAKLGFRPERETLWAGLRHIVHRWRPDGW